MKEENNKESNKEKNEYNKYLNLKSSLLYFALFAAISAAALYYIYAVFAEGANLELIFSFSFEVIISLAALLFFYFIFDGLRLYFVLKTLHADLPFFEVYKLVFINLFVSNITPMATGGGVAQVYFLQQRGVPLGKSSAAVVIRTLLASTMLFVSAPIIILSNEAMLALLPGRSVFLYALLFVGLYFGLFYILIFKNRIIKKIVYVLLHFLKNKHLLTKKRYKKMLKYTFEHLELFSEDLAYFIQGKKIFISLSFLFTFIFLISEFSFSYLLLRGMGYEVLFSRIISLHIIITFIMYFAPTPGASGVAEGGFSLLFAGLVAKRDIFPLLFYWRFFTKYIGIFIGIITFFFLIVKGDAYSEE